MCVRAKAIPIDDTPNNWLRRFERQLFSCICVSSVQLSVVHTVIVYILEEKCSPMRLPFFPFESARPLTDWSDTSIWIVLFGNYKYFSMQKYYDGRIIDWFKAEIRRGNYSSAHLRSNNWILIIEFIDLFMHRDWRSFKGK